MSADWLGRFHKDLPTIEDHEWQPLARNTRGPLTGLTALLQRWMPATHKLAASDDWPKRMHTDLCKHRASRDWPEAVALLQFFREDEDVPEYISSRCFATVAGVEVTVGVVAYANCCAGRYNTDSNPRERVPRGYITPYRPLAGLEGVKQAEIDMLAFQQHAKDCLRQGEAFADCCRPPDIAPEAMLLHEEGLDAIELDLRPADDDEYYGHDVSDCDAIRNTRTSGVAYSTPPGWLRAIAAWETESWLAGPIIRAHWAPVNAEEGAYGPHLAFNLVLDSIQAPAGPEITRELNPTQKAQILRHLLRDSHALGLIPEQSRLAEGKALVESLRKEYGPKWAQIWSRDFPRQKPWEMPDADDTDRNDYGNPDSRRSAELGYAGPQVLGSETGDEDQTSHIHAVFMDEDGNELTVRSF